MKVLIINGSARINGCTSRACKEMKDVLISNGIEVEEIMVGNKEIRGCINCCSCVKTGKCVFDDLVNEVASIFESVDGVVIATPVYYAAINGTLKSFLDRLFFSTKFNKSMKVGAGIISSRRAGSTSALDEINKYFTISSMPIASSTYWNEVHGLKSEHVELDLEGLQTIRNLATNMAFLIKSINLGKKEFGVPELETSFHTNFITKQKQID